ncbi:hypothetical protein KCV05_g93, partial [Aureobasidium melanogenum]
MEFRGAREAQIDGPKRALQVGAVSRSDEQGNEGTSEGGPSSGDCLLQQHLTLKLFLMAVHTISRPVTRSKRLLSFSHRYIA